MNEAFLDKEMKKFDRLQAKVKERRGEDRSTGGEQSRRGAKELRSRGTKRTYAEREESEDEEDEEDNEEEEDEEGQSAFSEEDEEESDEENQWDEKCYICKKKGRVMCCESCNQVAHLKCTELKREPSDWHCQDCLYKQANRRSTRGQTTRLNNSRK